MADIRPDTWLTEILRKPTFRVDVGDASSGIKALLDAHRREQSSAFYYAKVESQRVDQLRELALAGGFVVDVNVTFRLDRPSQLKPLNPELSVVEGTEADHARVLDIAGSTFQYTRFHLDPLISEADAHTVKREWVRNYCLRKRGDYLFAARLGGKAVGFLAALRATHGDHSSAVIDLVGVDRNELRRGIGAALVSAFVEHYRNSCSELLVGTQVANIPSMRLYESAGFSVAKSQYVVHLHTCAC